MLKLAETLTLAIGGIDANVAHVVDVVDRDVRIDRRTRSINHKKTIADIGKIELVKRALRLEDPLKVVLIALLRIRSRNHGKILGLRRILRKESHKSLNGEIQTLAVGVAIAVQEDNGLLGHTELRTKSRTIRKRLEDLRIRRMLKNLHLGSRTPGELRLIDLRPLGRKGLDGLTGLIDAIEERLRNPKIDLIQLRPDLVVCGLTIVLNGLQKLVDNERIILEQHDLRIDRINLLRKLIEPKALLTRILGRRRILRNHPLGNLAMIRVPRVTLESKVEDLDLGTERRHLTKKIVGDLRVSRGLIHMSAHKKNPH